MTARFVFRFAFAAVFVALIANAFAAAQARANKPLFRLTETPRDVTNSAANQKTSIAAVRESLIAVQLAARDLRRANALDVPLFDGKVHRAIRSESEGLEARAGNDLTWRGEFEDAPASSVTLTFKNGVVSGSIFAGETVYEIVAQNGKQVLVELDQSRFPECGGAISIAPPLEKFASAPNNRRALVAVDSSDRIDVLVIYTPAVKNVIGEAAAQNLAQQAIDVTNTVYANSFVRQRVRLAAAAEAVGYTESNNTATDLPWARTDANIAALREQYKADAVAMIVNAASDACGRGYLMSDVSTSFAPNAFTVTARGCAIGNLSFPHELGHNMGSQHNPENGGNAAFPFSYGHYVNGAFRTVMSYVDPCASGCVRVPYFSNPRVLYNNIPTGIAGARDNARSLDLTADTFANLRYSGSSLTLNQPDGNNVWTRNLPRRVAWTADNVAGTVRIEISRDGGRTFQTLVAETANDGEEFVTITGRPIKNARLRVASSANQTISDSSVTNFTVR